MMMFIDGTTKNSRQSLLLLIPKIPSSLPKLGNLNVYPKNIDLPKVLMMAEVILLLIRHPQEISILLMLLLPQLPHWMISSLQPLRRKMIRVYHQNHSISLHPNVHNIIPNRLYALIAKLFYIHIHLP